MYLTYVNYCEDEKRVLLQEVLEILKDEGLHK